MMTPPPVATIPVAQMLGIPEFAALLYRGTIHIQTLFNERNPKGWRNRSLLNLPFSSSTAGS